MGKHPAWLAKAMQTGGRVHKQDGGAAGPSKEDRDVELGKSLAKAGAGSVLTGGSLGILGGLKDAAKKVPAYRGPGVVGKALGAAGALLGAGMHAAGIQGIAKSMDRDAADHEREKAINRTDKKRGGRTTKKA